MAAREDQLEPLVRERRRPRIELVLLTGLGLPSSGVFVGERAVAADAVDRAVAGRVVTSHAPGLGGTPSRGQRSRRDRERLLRGVLGEVEVAEEADERGQRRGPTRRGRSASSSAAYRSTIGRTSTAPPMPRRRNPRGERESPVEVVAPRAGRSRRVTSLVSTNGPSVSERLAVLHANGRRRLRALQLHAVENTGFVEDRVVLADDRLELVLRMSRGVPASCKSIARTSSVPPRKSGLTLRRTGYTCNGTASADRDRCGR